jgi:hypothetical protein
MDADANVLNFNGIHIFPILLLFTFSPDVCPFSGIVDDCNGTDSTLSWDCQMRVYPVPVFLAVYLFFGSILLVNMLIAVFA